MLFYCKMFCHQLSEELGFPLRPKADLTFAKCLEKNLQKYITTIAKVAEVAGKEYAIEQVLNFIVKNNQTNGYT